MDTFARFRAAFRAFAGVGLLGLVGACESGAGDGAAPLAEEPTGVVSAGTPEATRAGLEILALGGNAVDAAVAVSLALGVTEPSESGLGGSAVVLIHPPAGPPVVVDVPPAAGGPAPTLVRVLAHAWSRHGSGRIPWERLVEPALRYAEEGWVLGRFRHRTLVREFAVLLADSAASALLLQPDRSIPTEGTTLTNPALAETLGRLAAGGPESFYGGDLAAALTAAAGDRGLALGLDAVPPARELPPLAGRYRGRDVYVPPPPYGGAAVLEALALLERAPPAVLDRDPWGRIAWLSEALAWAWQGEPRAAGTGEAGAEAGSAPPSRDPGAYLASLPSLPMTPPGDSAVEARSPGGAPSAGGAEAGGTPPTGGREREHTSHFSVVDGDGMAVAVSQSLGAPFGSGRPVLGFFPAGAPEGGGAGGEGAPGAGVQGGEGGSGAGAAADADPPGRLTEWMVPTILAQDGRVELVLGSPGGRRAVSAVLAAVSDRVDRGRPLDIVVAAPRVHAAPEPGGRPRLYLEGVFWSLASPPGATSRPGTSRLPQGTEPAGAPTAADSTPASGAATLDPGPQWSAAWHDGPGEEGGPEAWRDSVKAQAELRGFLLGEHDGGPRFEGLDAHFGGVNAVARTAEGWAAAADPRRDGTGELLTPEVIAQVRGGGGR